MISSLLIFGDLWTRISDIGFLILFNIAILLFMILFFGWKYIFKKDSLRKWEREVWLLIVLFAMIALGTFVKFYLDFPEFFS
jgi:hypothetical protein